jgi:anti-sigma factor RsiW
MPEGRVSVRLLSRDLVCEQAVRLATDYLDGSLGQRERRRFERHLRSCPNCTAYLEQLRITIALTGRVDSENISASTRDDLVELFKRFHRD